VAGMEKIRNIQKTSVELYKGICGGHIPGHGRIISK
jgi:hypothetical protein